MAFEYGEQRDKDGNIIHGGSWGIDSIPKDAFSSIIENFRVLRDEGVMSDISAESMEKYIKECKNYADGVKRGIVGNAPLAFSTLFDIADAIGNDRAFAVNILNKIKEMKAETDVMVTDIISGSHYFERTITLSKGISAGTGQILSITSDGTYGLADNNNVANVNDLVIVKSSDEKGTVVIETGVIELPSMMLNIGNALYLGELGNFTNTVPTESGKIVKCIGYAIDVHILKFKPDSFGVKLM